MKQRFAYQIRYPGCGRIDIKKDQIRKAFVNMFGKKSGQH